jgi:hypothetical protein
MVSSTTAFDTLKQILHNVQSPDLLDEHPWTQSLIVQDALINNPRLAHISPGQQLIWAIADLFRQLQPANPPRNGKRLDSRWGEFGLLAALYFTPFTHGTRFPTSLMDAWGRIDTAILYCVYGKPIEELSQLEVQKYQLVGSNLEYGSVSTLSDWHKKGLQRLTEIILNRESFLARNLLKSSAILQTEKDDVSGRAKISDTAKNVDRGKKSGVRRAIWLSVFLFLILALGFGAFKAWKVYQRGMLVYQDVSRLQELSKGSVGVETLNQVSPLLSGLRSDLLEFKQEAAPFLWLTPAFAWVPSYGYDLASAPTLIELAEHLLDASILSSEAAQPLLDQLGLQTSTLNPASLTVLLVQAQPKFQSARQELDKALAIREQVDVERLSPRAHDILVKKLDPVLALFDDGLSMTVTLPGLLGAGNEGPKTYLLLVENEDELRPTGGFITSVGNVVVRNGQILSLSFEEAGELEDWSKPYPAAPWQLQEYMNSPVLVLRDSNWFVDFPTAALWAEYLYTFTHSHSVDGVVAFDQHFLVMLLGEIGPVQVEGAPYPITDKNVIEYMRQSKTPPVGEPVPAGWYRKEFISKIANAVLKEFMGGRNRDWLGLAKTLSQALYERHLLLQFDNPMATGLIAKHDWDNTLQVGNGDYLMVTDTNIGFNKTNAVVDRSLTYDVDLSDLVSLTGTLTASHKNNASKDVPCTHWNTGQIVGEEFYPINRCYWNYLRVYKQQGIELLDATPHAIPGDWMLLGQNVPARVDELDEEINGVRGFGTLLVVPGGQTVNTSFKFALPASVVLQNNDGQFLYRLKVQKQPGTLANPLVIRMHLPNLSKVTSVNMDALIQNNNLLINTNLQTDVDLEVIFTRQ